MIFGLLGFSTVHIRDDVTPVMYTDVFGWISKRISVYDSTKPWVSSDLPEYLSIDIFYFDYSLGYSINLLDSSDKLGVSIGLGVISIGINSKPLYGYSESLLFNPAFGIEFDIINIYGSASFNLLDGFGFDLDAELFLLEGTIMFNDHIGIKSKVRLGVGACFKVSSSSFELGLLWWEVTLYFD